MARRRGERVFLPHLYKMYSSPNSTHNAMAAQVKRLDSSVKNYSDIDIYSSGLKTCEKDY
jgi:hypothetical protein